MNGFDRLMYNENQIYADNVNKIQSDNKLFSWTFFNQKYSWQKKHSWYFRGDAHIEHMSKSFECIIYFQHTTSKYFLYYTDSFPIFYRYFPETNETKAVFVMEIIGKTMFSLWKQFRPFHPIAVLQVGLETVRKLF